jgi:4-phospho-D-threonate 3-dehydrogenase / 4-phospho-D-erythronate 3-dehydrogenase
MTIGITMGDSSGVGPEILLKAFQSGQIAYPIVVFGDFAVLEECSARLGSSVALRKAGSPADCQSNVLNVIDLSILARGDVDPGRINARSGSAAREYVLAAARAAVSAEISAMVTLPMNKEATQLSDPGFIGHTELIGAVCGARDVTIMLVSEQLMVTHVSTHCSLRQAIERCRKDRICRIIELTCEAAAKLRKEPRIAVAGLNPHAGEHGLFGREEIEEIEPAVEWARTVGLPVEGPIPPDTVFHLAVRHKRYHAVVCMYHDQGHIPLKLLDFEGGVNVALGLPIIRTSVDHGTAFDIAWQGVASTKSFVAAVELAARLARGDAK